MNMIADYRHYHHDGKQWKRLTLVAVREEDAVFIGVAACSPKDTFKRKTGMNLAIHRAYSKKSFDVKIPHSFLLRCVRYFKDVPYQNIKW